MNEIKIDKGIPVPTETPKVFPLNSLEVGDSFSVPLECAGAARAAAFTFSKKQGRKFVTRTVVENEVKVVRIWRTE